GCVQQALLPRRGRDLRPGPAGSDLHQPDRAPDARVPQADHRGRPPVRVRNLFRSKAPLAVAALIAVPVYFAGLMASSLALDRPHVVGRHESPGTGGTEAKVWLAALIAPAIVMAAGAVGLLLRRHGIYLAALAGIVVCTLLPGLSHGWIGRHERRFPIGVDFIPDGSASNPSGR